MDDADDSDNLNFPAPAERLAYTGERYTSDIAGPIRHQHHHRYLFAAQFCAGRDVLDVACGEGYGSALLASVANSVRGVDLDPQAVSFAQRNYATPTLSFRQGDAARLVLEDSVDVVVSFETIEHLVEHDAFITGIRAVLRPGGLLIISSPDRTIYTEADAHENEFHLRELDRAEFKDLIARHFKNVVILEQDSLVGSVIWPEAGAQARQELFTTRDGRSYQRSMGAPRAHYLLAIASDDPLPQVSASALDDVSWVEQAQAHETHAVALAGEVGVRDREIGRLNGEANRLQRDIDELRAGLDERTRQLDDRARELDIVLHSVSWRLTGPLRRIRGVPSRLRRALRSAAQSLPAATRKPCQPRDRPSVLFVDWATPTPDQDAGSVSLLYQLDLFQSLGFDVAFMPVVRNPGDQPYLDALVALGVRLLLADPGGSPEQVLEHHGAEYDLIVLTRIHVAARFLAHLRHNAPGARIIFNTVDLHFLREEREAALEGSTRKAKAAAQRRQDELRCMLGADATIVLSEAEGELLAGLAPAARVEVIPFAWLLSDDVPPFAARSGVAFVGGFLHAPNVDAVKWLVAEIWPKVRQALPTATLEIVGSNTTAEIRALDSPQDGIVVRGFVRELDRLLSGIRVTIAPLRFGAGIKGKVTMSLASGIPCVATPIASEGVGAVDGEAILVGQTAEDLARLIVQVHEDQALWERLSEAGRVVIHERYSRQTIGRKFLDLVGSLRIAVPADAETKLREIKPRHW